MMLKYLCAPSLAPLVLLLWTCFFSRLFGGLSNRLTRVEDEISSFTDPLQWLQYFPPRGRDDMVKFGTAVDWRRSFVTTSVNPYYDSFVRWQFNTLKVWDAYTFESTVVQKCLYVLWWVDGVTAIAHGRVPKKWVEY